MTLGIEGLMKEYIGEIYSYVPNGFARAVFDANTDLKKNRYKDVVCNDRTRVVLHDGRPGDYIHANYVRGTRPGYILTQGPLKDSLFDFWRMIIQEQVLAICMLCEFQENGRWKCEPYYPELNESMTFGTITVKCEEMSKPDRHTHLKVLNVTDGATGKNVRVSHFKIVTWPDKTVALSNLSILRTHRALRKFVGNVVIHCSAGVGRTGTFVAIEIGVQLLLNGKTFRLSDLVKALRHCRMTSVQVDTQYLMMAETFVECGVIFKYIEDPKLIEGFEAFKKQVAEYVEAHPPPVEQYKLKGGKGEQPSMERLSAERVQPLSRGSKENPPCSVNPISPRPGDKPVSRSREQL
uniref:Protein-tyrosine-phosphatase n=1 Tax=Caenorhabditis japonica TaxID=281687 RepID=A0A8R1E1Q2_CAEJA